MPANRRQKPGLRIARIPNEATTSKFSDEGRRFPNVVGSYVGAKTTKGRRTRTAALVYLVSEKQTPKKLRRKNVLPRALEWSAQRSTAKELSTDVVQVCSEFKLAAVTLGPGDVAGDGPVATVGYAMRHPRFGDVVTTAGHLVLKGRGEMTFSPQTAPVVTLSNGGSTSARTVGRVVKAVCDDLRDYALVQPARGTACSNLFEDRYFIRQPYRAFEGDLHRPVRVLSASGIRASILRGVRGQLRVDATRIMLNLLITDYNTLDGDSGSSLIDEVGRTIGLLVGAFVIEGRTCSVFAPADVPLWSEGGVFL